MPIALVALIGLNFLYSGTYGNDAEWRKEISASTACRVNLQMAGMALIMYAHDHDGCLPPALMSLQEQDYAADENDFRCPGTRQNYRYVAYRKMPQKTAAEQPIVIDNLESHWIKFGLLGKHVMRTAVLFANGRIMMLENLGGYMDIYDQYGPKLSPEDAEILKACCKAWDNEQNLQH